MVLDYDMWHIQNVPRDIFKNILSIILKQSNMPNLYVWMVLNCDTWHNLNVPCGMYKFFFPKSI